MVVVVGETRETWQAAVVALPLPLFLLALLLPPADLVVQLHPAVHLVHRLPGAAGKKERKTDREKEYDTKSLSLALLSMGASNRGGGSGSSMELPGGGADARKPLFAQVRALPLHLSFSLDVQATVAPSCHHDRQEKKHGGKRRKTKQLLCIGPDPFPPFPGGAS